MEMNMPKWMHTDGIEKKFLNGLQINGNSLIELFYEIRWKSERKKNQQNETKNDGTTWLEYT